MKKVRRVYVKILALSVAILLMSAAIETNAAVIGGDYNDDIVAVYHFNSQTGGLIKDYGVSAVPGTLIEGATLAKGKYGKCLSLRTKASNFLTFDPHISLESHNKFSIVAWVKIPKQTDDFTLQAVALDPGQTGNVLIGSIYLTVMDDGNLEGSYHDVEDDKSSTLRTRNLKINNNKWKHIAFTVSRAQIKFYLNGKPLGKPAPRTRDLSFSGAYTGISIGLDAIGMVDDVGFFSDTFSDADIKFIHKVGLESIISIASVDPVDKIATTWGAIKSQR